MLARCPSCRGVFDPDRPAEASTGPDEPAEERCYVEVRSGVYGPASIARVARWIREARLDWEDLVCVDSGPWLPALEQRPLVQGSVEPEHAGPFPDDPPVKVPRPDSPAQRTPPGVAALAAGFLLLGVLTLNLPGVIVGAGLLSLRRWARRSALVLLALVALAALVGARTAAWGGHRILAATGGIAAVAAGLGIAYLSRRRVRGYFRPGGGARAAAALAVSVAVTGGLFVAGLRVAERMYAAGTIAGNGYGYTIARPGGAWINLTGSADEGDPAGAAREAGFSDADLELAREDGLARAFVVVEEGKGNAAACLSRLVERTRASGLDPTVYQRQDVRAGALRGEQAIVSVEREGKRVASLLTCFSEGGELYQLVGMAREAEFDRVRPELERMATSFRLDEDDDPLHLDIHTRQAAAGNADRSDPQSVASVVSRTDAAVVSVKSYFPGRNLGFGSGTLVREDGLIVTNWHVVEDAQKILVRIAGHGLRRARVVAVDEKRDLALLKVPGGNLPFAYLAAGPVRTGDDVIAIGSPMGLVHSVTKGIISSTRRMRFGVDYLQTDVSINPGNSGGPLLNTAGEVVGINTFIIRESEEVPLTGLNFALPSEAIRRMAEEHGLTLPNPPSHEPLSPRGDREVSTP
jgi:S1-C subfamily serine protease